MSDAAALLGLKRSEWGNRLRQFRSQSKFKLLVILGASMLFWIGLHQFFLRGLSFFRVQIGEQYFADLVGSMLYVFFLAMTLMLLISNAIICYSAFYRSRETAFLLAGPCRIENIFLYKYFESLGFSSWALLFLATPLIVAFGQTFALPAQFYLLSFVFFLAFMFIPASLGALLTMLLTNYLPNIRRKAIPLLMMLGLALLAYAVFRTLEIRNRTTAELRLVYEVFEEIEFTRIPLLPSYWVTRGILLLSQGEGKHREALFFFGVIAVNAAFLLSIAYSLSSRLLLQGWFKSQGDRRAKKIRGSRFFDAVVHRALFFLSREIRLIMVKDFKSFVRDPVQWSQFLVFFGLLGIYFANLRTFGYETRDLFWKMLISQMNLLATSLTLSTFASRFIYPQLSLEGRRYWVIGMVPMKRETILMGKLAVSFVSSVVISETLILVSAYMLSMPVMFALVHGVSLLGICMGLSGMAVGLGAVYPNFREDNPSKIISGFGGTLNLVLNLAFVLSCVIVQSMPFVLLYSRRSVGMDQFRLYLVLAMGVLSALSLAACMIPMMLGIRSIRRLEI
jgi:ABC-2 type transport system permease protein